jgi:hypothetical protein
MMSSIVPKGEKETGVQSFYSRSVWIFGVLERVTGQTIAATVRARWHWRARASALVRARCG